MIPSNLPQLRMVLDLSNMPRPVQLAEGFRLREADLLDADRLAYVLTEAFREPWDADRVRKELLESADVPKTFVVDFEERIVATASYQRKEDDLLATAWVHWVAVDPAVTGKGLGFQVVRAVLEEGRRRADSYARLTTDDFRMPAIKLYLGMGFEPELCHESHRERWSQVMSSISWEPS